MVNQIQIEQYKTLMTKDMSVLINSYVLRYIIKDIYLMYVHY